MIYTVYKDANTMAKDPAFLFYPGDYITGTMYLDFECKGAYIDLLMLQFQKDHMTLHMIQHVLGHKFEHIWSHICDKFVHKDGLYWNERLRKEKVARISYSKSRSDNKNSKKDMLHHMISHMEDIDRYIDNTLLKKDSTIGNLEYLSRVLIPFDEKKFFEKWSDWKKFKQVQHKFKYTSLISEEQSLKKLIKLSKGSFDNALEIVDEAMAQGWKGFFELKNNNNGQGVQTNQSNTSSLGKPGREYSAL